MRTITIELDDEAEKRFDDLVRRSKSRGDHHLINKALATYNFLVEGKSKENIVIVKTAWGNREFRIT
jgi:predicted transcriptional regulator